MLTVLRDPYSGYAIYLHESAEPLCSVCDGSLDRRSGLPTEIVSPHGMVHYEGYDSGTTCCGRDATGPKWMWPL